MIFVSGANGQLAHSVIANLLAEGRGESLVVGTRNVASPFARELAERGVQVRPADFREPALMREALRGVDRALLIPTYDSNDVLLQQNLNALEAAQAAMASGFKDFGAPHMIALTVEGNAASWGLMLRLGMERRPDLDFASKDFDPVGGVIIAYSISGERWQARQ